MWQLFKPQRWAPCCSLGETLFKPAPLPLSRSIYIPLPDTAARTRLVPISLGATPHNLTRTDLEELGAHSDGMSGADIAVLVRCVWVGGEFL